MGQHFPSREAKWKGVASRVFLEHVVSLLAPRRLVVVNVDATVIAQEPPLADHLPAMRECLSRILGTPAGCVSVKAKTTDHLGALGRGEGIAAQAVVLLGSET
jgi:2-C-methyl-D-erythritol 2,4-cyclodiphosphate synthase